MAPASLEPNVLIGATCRYIVSSGCMLKAHKHCLLWLPYFSAHRGSVSYLNFFWLRGSHPWEVGPC